MAVILAPFILIFLGYITLKKPGAVFAAYLYIPFYKATIQPILQVDITPVLAGACFLLSLANTRQRLHDHSSGTQSVFVYWSAVMCLVVAGATYSPNFDLAFSQSLNFLLLVFLPCCFGIRMALDKAVQRQFLMATVVLSIISIGVGASGLGVQDVGYRVSSLGANTIGTGSSAMLLPLVGLSIFRNAVRPIQLLLLLLMPAGVIVAIASGSRGPLLMGLISITIVQLAIGKDRGKRLLLLAAMSMGILILVQVPVVTQLIPSSSLTRIRSLTDLVASSGTSRPEDMSTTIRIELYQLAVRMFESKPVFGYGTAGFEAMTGSISELLGGAYPHNLLLQFAAEYGLVGISLVTLVVCAAFRRGFGYLHHEYTVPILTLALFAFLNSLVSGDIVGSRLVWGMLVTLLALPKTANDHAFAR